MNKFLTGVFNKINALAKKEKTKVYVVGGYVRDLLLAKEDNKDLDFLVLGSGLEFAKKLDKEFKKAGSLVEFADFDTARYLLPQPDGTIIELEFAGARSEVYDAESRKPKVTAATLATDLSRRDFTVNAMAVEVGDYQKNKKTKKQATATAGSRLKAVKNKYIVDLYNGREDIKNKILRTPLDPNTTFSDDPLRMLRAIRFAAQLNFSIEPKTLESIYKNRERIKIVSAERIQEELLKLLACFKPSIGLTLLWQTKILDLILPEVANLHGVEDIFGHQHKDNLIHTFKVVDNIAEQSPNVWLRMAGLLHDIGKAGTKKFIPKLGWTFRAHEHLGKKQVFGISRRLRFSKEHCDYVAKLVRWHLQPIALMDEGISDSAVRRLVVEMGDLLDDLLILGKSDITTGNPFKKVKRLQNYDRLKLKITEVLAKDKLRAFQSPVRGDEIMAVCQLKAGPTVGRIKEAIEEAILEGKIPNEYEPAKKYLLQIKDEYIKQAQEWELIMSKP